MKKIKGATLLELICYMGVLVLLTTLSYKAIHNTEQGSQRLRQNSEDILRTVQAGEQWRQDMRQATGQASREDDSFVISQQNHRVYYRFQNGTILRKTSDRPWQTVLSRVANSTMVEEKRGKITAYRWEIELQSHPNARIHPLFTFLGCPAGDRK